MLQLNIIKAARVKIRVDGLLRNQDGDDVPYALTLDCKRLDTDGLAELLAVGADDNRVQTIAPRLAAIIDGWDGVVGDDDRPVACTPQGVAELLRVPGMAAQVALAYVDQVQARAKN